MRGRRKAGVALGLLAALIAGIALTLSGCQSLGAHASGERLARITQSPEWRGDRFANPQPMWSDLPDAFLHALAGGRRSSPGARCRWRGPIRQHSPSRPRAACA